MTTLVTLEPGWQQQSGADSLQLIAAGELDRQLRRIGEQLATARGEVALRFAHEMNGDWYPWAGDRTAFIDAYQHLSDLMRRSAPSVNLVWSVNAEDHPSSNRFERYWPGAASVDVIGVDGYNCLDGWKDPNDIFGDALDRIHALSPAKPVWITETASCEADQEDHPEGASKAEWIDDLSDLIAARHITAVVWFDRNKEYDWRIDTSPGSRAALERMLTGTSR